MTKAFVLMKIDVGKVRDVSEALKSVKGVQRVDHITGPFDVIAVVEASDPNAISNLVTRCMHTISGIARTTTCFSLNGKAEN